MAPVFIATNYSSFSLSHLVPAQRTLALSISSLNSVSPSRLSLSSSQLRKFRNELSHSSSSLISLIKQFRNDPPIRIGDQVVGCQTKREIGMPKELSRRYTDFLGLDHETGNRDFRDSMIRAKKVCQSVKSSIELLKNSGKWTQKLSSIGGKNLTTEMVGKGEELKQWCLELKLVCEEWFVFDGEEPEDPTDYDEDELLDLSGDDQDIFIPGCISYDAIYLGLVDIDDYNSKSYRRNSTDEDNGGPNARRLTNQDATIELRQTPVQPPRLQRLETNNNLQNQTDTSRVNGGPRRAGADANANWGGPSSGQPSTSNNQRVPSFIRPTPPSAILRTSSLPLPAPPRRQARTPRPSRSEPLPTQAPATTPNSRERDRDRAIAMSEITFLASTFPPISARAPAAVSGRPATSNPRTHSAPAPIPVPVYARAITSSPNEITPSASDGVTEGTNTVTVTPGRPSNLAVPHISTTRPVSGAPSSARGLPNVSNPQRQPGPTNPQRPQPGPTRGNSASSRGQPNPPANTITPNQNRVPVATVMNSQPQATPAPTSNPRVQAVAPEAIPSAHPTSSLGHSRQNLFSEGQTVAMSRIAFPRAPETQTGSAQTQTANDSTRNARIWTGTTGPSVQFTRPTPNLGQGNANPSSDRQPVSLPERTTRQAQTAPTRTQAPNDSILFEENRTGAVTRDQQLTRPNTNEAESRRVRFDVEIRDRVSQNPNANTQMNGSSSRSQNPNEPTRTSGNNPQVQMVQLGPPNLAAIMTMEKLSRVMDFKTSEVYRPHNAKPIDSDKTSGIKNHCGMGTFPGDSPSLITGAGSTESTTSKTSSTSSWHTCHSSPSLNSSMSVSSDAHGLLQSGSSSTSSRRFVPPCRYNALPISELSTPESKRGRCPPYSKLP